MLKKFAIFGNPVEHSKSPNMHNAGFKHIGFDGRYEKYLLEDGEKIAEEFLKNGYEGANITVPFKEIAFKKAHEVRGIAKQIKAVNTYINENGKIIAYNTDAPGFLKAIESFKNVKNVLLLGAGGTAKAIALILRQNNINVHVLNRSKEKLSFFKDENITCFTWDEFEAGKYDLVVNSTSAGLKDENLPYEQEKLSHILKNSRFAFDCIYGKTTPFLALAKEWGCEVKDGKDMLLFQGVLAFELFAKLKASDELVGVMKESF